MFEVMSLRLDTGSQPWPPLFNSLVQCFPTFFQPGHTYLEPLTRRHTTAFLTLIMYMCVCVYRLKHQGNCDSYLAKSVQLCHYNSSFKRRSVPWRLHSRIQCSQRFKMST